MTSLVQDIQYKLKHLNTFEKIIAVNVLVFILGFILKTVNSTANSLQWLELPKNAGDFIYQPWSIITYGFTHYGFLHFAINMLVLYFITNMLLNLFNSKILLNVYFLGIIFGGLAFLLVYNVLPERSILNIGSLVGASAGIRALVIFLSAYMPQREVKIMMFSVKLWHIGIALVVIDILGLFSTNQGGSIAHLGGSLLGYLYATQLQKGSDIGKGFEKMTDNISEVFKKKSPLKTVHKNTKKTYAGHNKDDFNEFNKQKRIDLILDKIGKSGYESLTEDEKAFLFKTGKN
ncbi:rhomboid family intramembrane serine protease [Lacinutrix undariae]